MKQEKIYNVHISGNNRQWSFDYHGRPYTEPVDMESAVKAANELMEGFTDSPDYQNLKGEDYASCDIRVDDEIEKSWFFNVETRTWEDGETNALAELSVSDFSDILLGSDMSLAEKMEGLR